MNQIDKDNEPVIQWKWLIVAAFCFCALITFSFGVYVGRTVAEADNIDNAEPTIVETVTATDSIEETAKPITFSKYPKKLPAKESLIKPSFDELSSEFQKDNIVEETQPIDVVEPPSEPVSEPETDDSISDSTLTETEMLAIVIYQEAGGNACCDECRRRVADIVLNRVSDERFPNSIYEVLTQKAQYGRLYWTDIKWPDRAASELETDAVERALRIAREVMNGQHSEVYGNGYVWQAGFIQGNDGFWCCGHYFGR